jgi:hypothetical protein
MPGSFPKYLDLIHLQWTQATMMLIASGGFATEGDLWQCLGHFAFQLVVWGCVLLTSSG